MYPPRQSYSQSGDGDGTNLFVKYIPSHITNDELEQMFQSFGKIQSAKIIFDNTTKESLGYGFVKFQDPASAAAAIEGMNGHKIDTKTLLVKYSISPQKQTRSEPNSSLYVKPLPSDMSEAELRQMFSPYGTVTGTTFLQDRGDSSRGIVAFVRYGTIEEAERAIRDLHDTKPFPELMNLTVKFADADKSRKRDDRGGGGFGDRFDRPPRGDRSFGDRPPRGDREFGDRAPRGDRSFGDRPPRGDRDFGDRPRGERGYGDRGGRGDREEHFDRSRGGGDDRSFGDRRPRNQLSRPGFDAPPNPRFSQGASSLPPPPPPYGSSVPSTSSFLPPPPTLPPPPGAGQYAPKQASYLPPPPFSTIAPPPPTHYAQPKATSAQQHSAPAGMSTFPNPSSLSLPPPPPL